ncbi:tRNA uridine(34) 5-carboxymethylaminomethyl modification radical SAM/GNAT enzyme Elp3 [Candidatus Woesearchaeota archaeon]|nr:tRNA uridine(34) 5-carboxymethylaminomethyl modification radical SAM/GNAT enzyme Elp3 [Candidatus Woesearchaeota archaeon]
MDIYTELVGALKKKRMSNDELSKLKMKLCAKYRLREIPTNIQILLHAEKGFNIVTKPGRSLSGVTVVTIMTAPIACRHGRCAYCPGGPGSAFGDIPQSYTGNEPASMRAARAHFDPYIQVFNRLEQYIVTGHEIDKIEMIINGGTFTSMPLSYQKSFITYALKALNDFSDYFFRNGEIKIGKFKEFFELPGDFMNKERVKRVQNRILKLKKKSTLDKEKIRNTKAKARCVALCIETRPDWCGKKEISNILNFSATRVEIGVQSLQDRILEKVGRGHGVSESILATQLLKDSLLKVCYHMMPGLPLSTKKSDIAAFKELFRNPDFRPDALKIYPTMVMQGTELYKDWKKGNYNPLTTKQAAEIIAEAKKHIPEYCRIMRVQRDIPTKVIAAGVDRTNLRQYVDKIMKEKNIQCRCIRCREPKQMNFADFKLKTTSYESSGGEEFFIAAESNDKLLGFCRLRIPYKPFMPQITKKSAGIRELHVYGRAASISKRGEIQHRGIGKALMAKAEGIARENKRGKMLIISGIGARQYYRRLGYRLEGPYMARKL